MLLKDYALNICLWWNVFMSVIPLYIETFDQPVGARIKALADSGIRRMKDALLDLDCLFRIEAICVNLRQNAPAPAGD